MKALMSLMTVGRIFVAVLAVMLGVLLWSNADTILTKLGMQTKSSLVKEVNELNQTVHTLEWMNADNRREIQQLQEDNAKLVKALQDLEVVKVQTEHKAQKLQKDLKDKTQALREEVAKRQTVTDTSVTLPRQEVEQLSQTNITALHTAMSELFPS